MIKIQGDIEGNLYMTFPYPSIFLFLLIRWVQRRYAQTPPPPLSIFIPVSMAVPVRAGPERVLGGGY